MIELPIKHPELFTALGIAQPKGVLLYGPPGTGKTLLARAVAHHTDCTFIRVSGSELVQKYIGEGSRMVRELFVMARENAPSIIFMDEIDSIGGARSGGGEGGDSEVQRTMLELLNQLDGFEPSSQIKVRRLFVPFSFRSFLLTRPGQVLMCTNRIDILDPALLRPGRIDRKIEFPNPTESARVEILRIHSKRMNLTRGIDFKAVGALLLKVTPSSAVVCVWGCRHFDLLFAILFLPLLTRSPGERGRDQGRVHRGGHVRAARASRARDAGGFYARCVKSDEEGRRDQHVRRQALQVVKRLSSQVQRLLLFASRMKRVKLLSQSYLPLQTETPAGVPSASHRALVQGGCVRALGSGVFSWLPYGHALLARVAAVIEEEMESVLFERCAFAALQPRAIWEDSGRWDALGGEMFRVRDRRGAELALAPTAEEAFVAAAAEHAGRLPVRLYQLGPKWRDETRPRAGPLRAREFVMKARRALLLSFLLF